MADFGVEMALFIDDNEMTNTSQCRASIAISGKPPHPVPVRAMAEPVAHTFVTGCGILGQRWKHRCSRVIPVPNDWVSSFC